MYMIVGDDEHVYLDDADRRLIAVLMQEDLLLTREGEQDAIRD